VAVDEKEDEVVGAVAVSYCPSISRCLAYTNASMRWRANLLLRTLNTAS